MANARIHDLAAAPGVPNASDIVEAERDPASSQTSEKLTWTLIAQCSAFKALFANVDSGGAAPSSTPDKVGDLYVDTVNDQAYIAIGTATSGDWFNIGSGGGGATNLTWDAANSQVVSDTGADATLSLVDATNPGLMSVAQRALLLIAPEISEGVVAPSSTPTKVGNIYIDTGADEAYIAVGTTSSADWFNIGSGGGGGVTDLAWDAATSTITNSAGDNAVLTDVDGTNPGLMTPAMLATLGTVEISTDTSPQLGGDLDLNGYVIPGMEIGVDLQAHFGTAGALASQSVVTTHHYETITFPDTVAEDDLASAWRCPATGTLVEAIIWCDIAPTTSSIIVDLTKNGTTVFTGGTQRPVIATSSTSDWSGAPSITTMIGGSLFQFVVSQLNVSDQGNIGQLMCMIHWTQETS